MFGPLKRLFSKPDSPPPPAPAPVVWPISMAASAPKAAAPPPAGDVIQVPLSEIVARLPATLTPLILSTATGTFPLPVQTALAQLPTGAVRIPFAQLRQHAPPGTFAANPSLDNTLVDLPLPRILAGINPALLARRPNQKQVTAPDEVSGIFEAKDKARAASPPPKPIPQPAAPAPASQSAPVPTPAPLPTAQKPVTPPAPAMPKPATPPVSAMPKPATLPPPAAQKPVAAPTPVAQKPAMPSAPAAQKEAALTVPLAALYEFWPEPIRQEITQAKQGDAVVSLPMDRLSASMKSGRVAFSWGEVVAWMNVAAPAAPSPQRETVLEFPLKLIAPLFMARRSAAPAQKKIIIGDNIPDLFSGLAKPAAPPTPAPIAAPVLAAPARDEWSPQEIIKKIEALPGVAGSLIVTSDGLMVTGNAPPPLKAETMAAFLPQLFGRVGQYAGEIQLQPLSALTLMAGETRCAIFKTGKLYLAVVGRPGQTLPDALLQCLAEELAKRNP